MVLQSAGILNRYRRPPFARNTYSYFTFHVIKGIRIVACTFWTSEAFRVVLRLRPCNRLRVQPCVPLNSTMHRQPFLILLTVFMSLMFSVHLILMFSTTIKSWFGKRLGADRGARIHYPSQCCPFFLRFMPSLCHNRFQTFVYIINVCVTEMTTEYRILQESLEVKVVNLWSPHCTNISSNLWGLVGVQKYINKTVYICWCFGSADIVIAIKVHSLDLQMRILAGGHRHMADISFN